MLKLNFLKIGKRGIHIWISWVLVISFMVSLGVMLNIWSQNYSKKQFNSLENSVVNPLECDSVSLILNSICQNEQGLIIHLKNKGYRSIKKIIINYRDSSGEFKKKEIDTILMPDNTKRIIVLKNSYIDFVAITPVISYKNKLITCSYKEIKTTNIDSCS